MVIFVEKKVLEQKYIFKEVQVRQVGGVSNAGGLLLMP